MIAKRASDGRGRYLWYETEGTGKAARHITQAEIKISSGVAVTIALAEIEEARGVYIDEPAFSIESDAVYYNEYEHYVCLTGRRYCTADEEAFITECAARDKEARRVEREKKAERERREFDRLSKKFDTANRK